MNKPEPFDDITALMMTTQEYKVHEYYEYTHEVYE